MTAPLTIAGLTVTGPDGRVSQIGEAHLLVRKRPSAKDKP